MGGGCIQGGKITSQLFLHVIVFSCFLEKKQPWEKCVLLANEAAQGLPGKTEGIEGYQRTARGKGKRELRGKGRDFFA